MAWLLLLQLAPEKALESFRVAPGYRIELVAAEPDVRDPVAMAFDEDGRIYVAEMRDYPSGPAAGAVRLLEDVDGDGRVDRSRAIAETLRFPSGVMPWRGGVLIAAGFEVFHAKGDQRRTVLTGFAPANTQHLVNGFQMGLDNWIYAANGLSGGTVGGVTLRAADFRFRPDTGEVRAVSGNSQFGNAFDERGRRFIVTHDNHLIHPVLPREALEAARASPAAAQDSLSDHGLIPKLYPASARDTAFTTDTDSSCGVAIWRGQAFVCEPVLNLVHRDALVPKGASFTATRVDRDSEFLASTDPWCRPVFLCDGPDGALYVVDMYRAVIEHPDYIPKDVRPRLDLRAGADRGRIWRVVPLDAKPAPRPRLGSASTSELVAHLSSANPWWRRTAQRLLVERKEGVDLLRRLLREGPPLARLHAFWTLDGLGVTELDAAARDVEPALREAAVARGAALTDDPDARVRFRIALASRDPAVLASIARRDAADPWALAAVLLSASWDPPAFVERLPPSKELRDLVRRLAESVGPPDAAAWLKLAAASPWGRTMLHALPGLRRAGVAVDVAPFRAFAERALAAASDAARPVEERMEEVETLRLLAPPGAPAALEGLLRTSEPPALQAAAVRALAAGEAWKPFERWAERTPALRKEIVGAALRRPDRTGELLDRMERGEIRPVELDPAHRAELGRQPRARKLFEAAVSPDREELIREIWSKMETMTGDRERGRKVFASSCLSCHRLGGEGAKVGPDLDAIRGKDPRALLTDLLDPNRAMDPSYQVYVARTTSGELVNGIVVADGPAGVTLRRAAGEETVLPRAEIAELKAWPASLMPEGLELNLSARDFADLLAYLLR